MQGAIEAMSESWAWQGRQQVGALEPRSDWTGLGGHEGPNARADLATRASLLYCLWKVAGEALVKRC